MSQAEDEQPLPSHEEAAILAALEAALRPTELDPQLNERFIAWALEDPLAPASPEELVESERLRDALAGNAEHEATDMLAALRAPFSAAAEAPMLERALQDALAGPPKRQRTNVVYVAFGAASGLLAAAAAIALLIGTPTRPASAPTAAWVAPQLVKPHTTTGLFAEPFEVGSTTARMDRIASARSRELRDNRYSAWGVR